MQHKQIALAIQPYRTQIRAQRWSWIIPTIVLIIISFPPLFGHELVILAVGLIWGLLLGFAIACLGTFVGELATYAAFKYLFRRKAAQLERKNVTYACLAQLMRDGGWKMLTLVRFSAIPGHITTAIQSTIGEPCRFFFPARPGLTPYRSFAGVGIWVFAVACALSLPKQFALVYLGVLLGQTERPGQLPEPDPGTDNHGAADQYTAKHRSISLIVFFVTGAASVVAAYIIWIRMRRLRPTVQADIDAKAIEEAGTESARDGSISLAERGSGSPRSVGSTDDDDATKAAAKKEDATGPTPYRDLPSAANSILTLPRYSFTPRSRSGTNASDMPPLPAYRDRSDTMASRRSALLRPRVETMRSFYGLNSSASLPHLPYTDTTPVGTPRGDETPLASAAPGAEPANAVIPEEPDYFSHMRRKSVPVYAHDWTKEDTQDEEEDEESKDDTPTAGPSKTSPSKD